MHDQVDRGMSFSDLTDIKCDDMSSIAWYRMMGRAGDQIPEKCVPMNHCGTRAPGWLNGKHPTVKDGVVTRQVCYNWNDNCCNWKNDIKIRNCGDFYVYQLPKPPSCSLRYCGNGRCLLIPIPISLKVVLTLKSVDESLFIIFQM